VDYHKVLSLGAKTTNISPHTAFVFRSFRKIAKNYYYLVPHETTHLPLEGIS